MKRIALLLAAVGLGSGCIVDTGSNCAARTLTVDWAFVASDGTYYASCTDAGVDWVEIWIDGVNYGTADCFSGVATLSGVPSGSHSVVVEGVTNSGRIVSRDPRNGFGIASCGDTYLPADPGEAVIQIDYVFSPVDACAGGSHMWYSLFDEIAGAAAVDTVSGVAAKIDGTDDYVTKTSKACGQLIAFTVPYGTYSLDWISEVSVSGTYPYGGTVLAESCGAKVGYVPDAVPGSIVHLPVTLVNAGTCP